MPSSYNTIKALYVLKMQCHTTERNHFIIIIIYFISRPHVRNSKCVPVQRVPLEPEPDDKTQIRPQDSEAMPEASTAP